MNSIVRGILAATALTLVAGSVALADTPTKTGKTTPAKATHTAGMSELKPGKSSQSNMMSGSHKNMVASNSTSSKKTNGGYTNTSNELGGNAKK
jgi:FlaG/FlaF family flagellin (archaellin)